MNYEIVFFLPLWRVIDQPDIKALKYSDRLSAHLKTGPSVFHLFVADSFLGVWLSTHHSSSFQCLTKQLKTLQGGTVEARWVLRLNRLFFFNNGAVVQVFPTQSVHIY